MKSIQDNLSRLSQLNSILEDHLVGGTLKEDTHLTYIFVEPYGGLNGVRVYLEKGKINAMEVLIEKLDELYNKEFSWSSNHTVLSSL